MEIAAIILILILAVLLILVVLVQNPKGGLNSQFAGGGASQVMGVQNTNNLLEKLTWGFAVGILVLSLMSNSILKDFSGEEDLREDANVEAAQEKGGMAPLQTAPEAETAPVEAIDTAE